MATAGFEAVRSSWAFRHHVLLERQDIGYGAFMRELLSAADWAFFQQQEQVEPLAKA